MMSLSGCFMATPSQNENGMIPLLSNANAVPQKNNGNVTPIIPLPPKGIIIESPQPNEEIISPVHIQGYVTGEGWIGFEGMVGSVTLQDEKGNIVGTTSLNATTDWMKLPTSFETTLSFSPSVSNKGVLIFKNDNPSGLSELAREYNFPILFGANNQETMNITIYLSGPMDDNTSCDKVYAVGRTTLKTKAVAQATMKELLKGPSQGEKDQKFSSFFSDATKDALLSLIIKNETAYVNLADLRKIIPNASTSCGSSQLMSQIETTLKQFPTINKVIVAFDGDPQTFYDWIQVGCDTTTNNCDKTPFTH